MGHESRLRRKRKGVRARSSFLSFGCGGKRVPRAFSGVVNARGRVERTTGSVGRVLFLPRRFLTTLGEARVLPRAKHKAPWTKMKWPRSPQELRRAGHRGRS